MMKQRIARWMRRAADRIDRHGAPKVINWSFTFESGEGIRFRDDGKGCGLAYLGDDDYHRAHDEADNPTPRIDWEGLAANDQKIEQALRDTSERMRKFWQERERA